MSVTTTWDTAFENAPAGTDPGSVVPAAFQALKEATRQRIELEHGCDPTAAANHGRHLLGSARAFVSDADPGSAQPVAPDPLTDIAKGRILFRPTSKTIKVNDGTSWVEPDYLRMNDDVAQTVDGVKTFEVSPLCVEAQVDVNGAYEAAIGETALLRKDAIDARISLAISDLTKVTFGPLGLVPVGFVYTQFPGRPDPDTLFGSLLAADGISPAIWAQITEWPSAFFRAEGNTELAPGDADWNSGVTDAASAFESGVQKGAILEHKHAYENNSNDNTVANGLADWESVSDDAEIAHDTGIPKSVDADSEISAKDNRPRNFTVRIWERTA